MPVGKSLAQRLAFKLRTRCMKELGGVRVSVAGEKRGSATVDSPPYRHVVGDVGTDRTGTHYFEVVGQTLERSIYGGGRAMYNTDWQAIVRVTPDLDITVEDAIGHVERAVLDCALRGPD